MAFQDSLLSLTKASFLLNRDSSNELFLGLQEVPSSWAKRPLTILKILIERMRMKQTILVLGITFICLFNPACSFSSGPVKGTVAGVEVIVESLKRTKESNVP